MEAGKLALWSLPASSRGGQTSWRDASERMGKGAHSIFVRITREAINSALSRLLLLL